jgi:hypothetical protein
MLKRLSVKRSGSCLQIACQTYAGEVARLVPNLLFWNDDLQLDPMFAPGHFIALRYSLINPNKIYL